MDLDKLMGVKRHFRTDLMGFHGILMGFNGIVMLI